MEHAHIEQQVVNAIGTVLKRRFASVDEITRQRVNEWDSLKHMEIMFVLEDELEVEFGEEELADLDSAAKIIAAIEARHVA